MSEPNIAMPDGASPDGASPDGAMPAVELFSNVVGQPGAVAALRKLARQPVHAYLLLGPPGSGVRQAARAFGAALVCPNGGCGKCPSCRQALADRHPDVVTVERTGASLSVEDARRLVGLAQRRPFGGARQVLMVPDVHLATRSAPALLKTVEEPPASTVFVLLADDMPPELTTVASRCVKVTFPPVTAAEIVASLESTGVDRSLAVLAAEGAEGDVERARLLVTDPEYSARLDLWKSIPEKLDGRGATAGALAQSLLDAIEQALDPVRARQAQELELLAEEARRNEERGVPGRKDLVEAQHRELRRWRTDEIRSGLAALARRYRSLLDDAVGRPVDSGGRPSPSLLAPGPQDVHTIRRCQDAVAILTGATRSLRHNPNERLLLESVLVRLGTAGD